MKYWAYMNGEVPGSFLADELAALPGFSQTTLVCQAEGEIAEKNWRRAGEFPDIARALSARDLKAPPPPPAAAAVASAALSASADVDAMIDGASTRLFSHVADLMKELESRREEKALLLSFQRQIAALKEELTQTRERANMLEMRLPRIAELEDAQRKDRTTIESLQAGLVGRDQAVAETRALAERLKNDLEATKRRLQETTNDLTLRNRLVDRISKDLSEKELSLAKSLGVIRRLEEDLHRLCPDPALSPMFAAPAPTPQPIPAPTPMPTPLTTPPPAPAPVTVASVDPVEPPALTGPAIPPAPAPSAPVGYTTDDPPPTPPYLEPHPQTDGPKAQQALVSFLKRIFPGQSH